MSLRVEQFAGTSTEWNEFGRRQRGWTAFHRLEWREHVSEVFRHDCPFLCARSRQGALEGILPLVKVHSSMFGRFLVSMPFVSYGGPVGSDAAVHALVEEAKRIALQDDSDLLELRSSIELPLDMSVSHRKIAVVLPLTPGDPDAVFKGFRSKLRSQVRRPGKSGVTIRIGPDQVEPFFQVFTRHMRDLGTPALPVNWFTALPDRFGNDVWFSCAWLDGEPIAGGAGFRDVDEFEITWASALREHSSTAANLGVYWALIERAAREGLSRFNFGRCTPNSSTHVFKRQWGAVDESLYWYQQARRGVVGTPRPDSSKYALATRVWRRLPLVLTNSLGPRIVRYLP